MIKKNKTELHISENQYGSLILGGDAEKNV
jgi:hypothetical protein